MTALYLFGAFLVVLLAGVVLAPLVEREPPERDLEELPPAERHEAAVEALAELEFEYRTDKLPEDEYRRLRARYGRIALEAEEATEAGGGEPGGEGPAPDDGDAADTEAAEGGRGEADARGPRSCPGCGDPVPGGARFCPGCGEPLQGEHEEA